MPRPRPLAGPRLALLAAALCVQLGACAPASAQGPAPAATSAPPSTFNLIVQRSNTAMPLSGRFRRPGSAGEPSPEDARPLAAVQGNFRGGHIPLEVLTFSNSSLGPNDLCMTLCQPDRVYKLFAGSQRPNDPYLPYLWGMRAIRADQAWQWGAFGNPPGDNSLIQDNRSALAEQVKVCMTDTGNTLNHTDMAANLWINAIEASAPGATAANGYRNGRDDDGNGIVDDIHGVSFLGGTVTGEVIDPEGHGSHTSGTVAAVGNNGIGVTGVSQVASVISCRSASAHPESDDYGLPTSSDIKCWDYCASKGAHIINNSWGGPGPDDALTAAMESLAAAGILVVVAAGNSGVDIDAPNNTVTPAGIPSDALVAVTAVNTSQQLPVWANFGATSVQLAAPGEGILSLSNTGGYRLDDGTSMAAPHVSGAAALILDRYAQLGHDISTQGGAVGRAADVKRLLLQSATRLPSLDGLIAGGLVDVAAALQLVPPLPASPSAAPTPSAVPPGPTGAPPTTTPAPTTHPISTTTPPPTTTPAFATVTPAPATTEAPGPAPAAHGPQPGGPLLASAGTASYGSVAPSQAPPQAEATPPRKSLYGPFDIPLAAVA